MISKRQFIKEYYTKKEIADRYVSSRFKDPLNVVEHLSQVRFVNKVISKYTCNNVLEVAPGPARITEHIFLNRGTAIDSSDEMITRAKTRMRTAGKNWEFIKGDAFNMNFSKKFDLIYTFRFLLHFKLRDRAKLYSKCSEALKPNGYLVFEVMNRDCVFPLRLLLGKKRYFIYDKLYSKSEIINELDNQGFTVLEISPVLRSFWIQALISRPFIICGLKNVALGVVRVLEKYIGQSPYEWVLLCQKK